MDITEQWKKEVGNRIRNIRITSTKVRNDLQGKKPTLERFAELVDSNKSNVSRWERGLNVPNEITLRTIADYGDISVNELLHGNRDEIISRAMDDALEEFLDVSNKNIQSDYERNKKRYDELLAGLYEKYTKYNEHILPIDSLYIRVRSLTSKELSAEYIKGARTNESSLLYLRSVLEDAHITVSKYEHDPLTQRAIKKGEISKDVFEFVINDLMETKKELNTRLKSIDKFRVKEGD